MFQTLFSHYRNYRWLRIVCAISLLLCAMLFIVLFDGFPPLAWHFLVHVIITLPVLWTTRGLLVILPLIGLVLQSFLIMMLWLAWTFAIIKVFQYEVFRARQQVVQEEDVEQEEQEVEPHVQHTSFPAQPSPFDALPDTVYPRMPSSARRYSTLTAPAQHATSSPSPIPARASAHLIAVHEPVPMSAVRQPLPIPAVRQSLPVPIAHHASREARRPQGSPLHVEQHEYVGETAKVALFPPRNTTYSGDTTYYDEDTVAEFAEHERFLDELDEDQVCDEDVLQEQAQLRLIVGIGSHPGIVRKNGVNEDNVLGLQDTFDTGAGTVPVGLFVVADGMGGHKNGQEASRLAVCSVSEVVTPTLLHANTEDVFCEELLQDGVQNANAAIYQHNQQKFTMGTTITTALVFGSTAFVANVGDSRTYLYRASDGLTQITSDHSHVWQLFKEGCITHEDIYTHPKRNEIYRCLGEGEHVEIDTFQVTLQADDVLLLCTDGLWEMVRDAEIEQIIQNNALHASQMSAKLIEAALRNGGADNVSAVVVCIDSHE